MKPLKKYLTINSIFSAICGGSMLLFSTTLKELFDISNIYVFPIIGATLLLFSAWVWYVSNKQLKNKILVLSITILDWLWVLGSIIILLLGLFNISSIGKLLISIVAIWIGFLGYKQFIYNKYATQK